MTKTTHKESDPLKPSETGSGDDTGHPEKAEERLSQEDVVRVVVMNGALRQIVAILINGKRSQGTSSAFLQHPMWIQRMFNAYKEGQAREFMTSLETYLKMIPLFTPQTGRIEQVPALVAEVERLVEHPDIGLQIVGKRILSVLNAPL